MPPGSSPQVRDRPQACIPLRGPRCSLVGPLPVQPPKTDAMSSGRGLPSAAVCAPPGSHPPVPRDLRLTGGRWPGLGNVHFPGKAATRTRDRMPLPGDVGARKPGVRCWPEGPRATGSSLATGTPAPREAGCQGEAPAGTRCQRSWVCSEPKGKPEAEPSLMPRVWVSPAST